MPRRSGSVGASGSNPKGDPAHFPTLGLSPLILIRPNFRAGRYGSRYGGNRRPHPA